MGKTRGWPNSKITDRAVRICFLDWIGKRSLSTEHSLTWGVRFTFVFVPILGCFTELALDADLELNEAVSRSVKVAHRTILHMGWKLRSEITSPKVDTTPRSWTGVLGCCVIEIVFVLHWMFIYMILVRGPCLGRPTNTTVCPVFGKSPIRFQFATSNLESWANFPSWLRLIKPFAGKWEGKTLEVNVICLEEFDERSGRTNKHAVRDYFRRISSIPGYQNSLSKDVLVAYLERVCQIQKPQGCLIQVESTIAVYPGDRFIPWAAINFEGISDCRCRWEGQNQRSSRCRLWTAGKAYSTTKYLPDLVKVTIAMSIWPWLRGVTKLVCTVACIVFRLSSFTCENLVTIRHRHE